MTTNVEELGKSISDATLFLQKIHADIRAQIGSFDRLMDERGWIPPDAWRNRVSWLLGNSLNDGKQWVIDNLYRSYIRKDAAASTDRVISVVWYLYFDPGDAYEVSTCLFVAARLAAPEAPLTMLHSDWSTGMIYQAAGRNPHPVPLSETQISPFLPRAKAAVGLVLPLCELTNEQEILRRGIDPILQAEQQLA